MQTLIKIILDSKSDEFRLRAIKQLSDTVGLGPDNAMPVSAQNQSFLNILKLVEPQVRKEARKRGLEVDANIKEVTEAAEREDPPVVEEIITNSMSEEEEFDSDSEGDISPE
jgi:hypothetical protein